MTTAVRDQDAARPPHLRPPGLVTVCAVLAGLSLPLPVALGFDPWAWLVWGRELAGLDLDTTGGPSWKPLPVLVTTLLAPLGDGPAELLLALVVRTVSLLAIAAVYRLAARFAGPAAGAVAAALLVLSPDGDPRFLRLVAEGHVAVPSVAFAVFAVESHLDGRRGRALLLLWLLAMDRPEAWPLLAAYAAWTWRREPALRRGVALAAVSVPLLWFVPDWLGSGDPLLGAGAAQVAVDVHPFQRLVDAVAVAGAMVVAPAWIAAAAALFTARRRRGEGVLLVAGAAAAAWSGLVVVMGAVLGYAALSRFFLPATGIVCVLAGIGMVRLGVAARGASGRRRWGALAVAVLAFGFALPRVLGLGPVVEELTDRGRLEDDLDELLAQAGGRGRMASCGEVGVAGVGLLRTAVAWKLELPLHDVPQQLTDGDGVLVLPADGTRAARLGSSPVVEPVARTDRWVALAVRCPSAMPDS